MHDVPLQRRARTRKLTPLHRRAWPCTRPSAGAHELPQYHTLDYDVKLEFANGKTITLVNSVGERDDAGAVHARSACR